MLPRDAVGGDTVREEVISMTKRIARLAFAAAAAAAVLLPAAPANAHCTYVGTFVEICSPLG